MKNKSNKKYCSSCGYHIDEVIYDNGKQGCMCGERNTGGLTI